MTADPRSMRGQAEALRRAADRLTILRLRLANAIADLSIAEEGGTRQVGAEIHEHWTREEYPELGRIASGLRASARRLDATAIAAERSTGRRLGGYTGAGFLGRGDEAHRHVADVAAFVGTQQGASIGGFPLLPGAEEGILAHPSHTLGIDTPDYDEDA
ncbi:hypothetical protein CFK38_14985 [Brachybacterium vulturis]|uniref:Uncharacterized protein n=1 Tax=Brachybacterium vulturis TaxID=2017484 RepID=A0A291GRW4_9MICO|nr:hypothetical protein [Brachybacterium vulturis]ATG52684.1 hypothetical protein CFK38_14985 [Brachybacterium vulturis]